VNSYYTIAVSNGTFCVGKHTILGPAFYSFLFLFSFMHVVYRRNDPEPSPRAEAGTGRRSVLPGRRPEHRRRVEPSLARRQTGQLWRVYAQLPAEARRPTQSADTDTGRPVLVRAQSGQCMSSSSSLSEATFT